MSIIFSEAGLVDIAPPCVVQTFVNHNARLFKIFIIGSRYFIIQRPSIKNFKPGGELFCCLMALFATHERPGNSFCWQFCELTV